MVILQHASRRKYLEYLRKYYTKTSKFTAHFSSDNRSQIDIKLYGLTREDSGFGSGLAVEVSGHHSSVLWAWCWPILLMGFPCNCLSHVLFSGIKELWFRAMKFIKRQMYFGNNFYGLSLTVSLNHL